jgi:predicted lipid-binding transport protein (Tim44 family)
MRQIIVSILVSLSASAFAEGSTPTSLSPELKKEYDGFQQDYEEALKINDKQKFLKDFKKVEANLQKKYKAKKEGKALTEEGNQMALDIEMLEPLRIIAEGNASKESCTNATFINDLNNKSDTVTYDKVKAQIAKLCK